MAKRALSTITLAAALASALGILAACSFGITLKSEELMLSQAQIQEAREKAAEESEGGWDLDSNKDDEKEKPLPRVVPQVSEDTLFTLIYLLGRDKEDQRRAVILDFEDDGVEFIPTVPGYEYEILQSVSISEAIYETEIFFGHQAVITNYYFKRVLGPEGSVIGYEIRPTYVESMYGNFDPLKIEYKFKRRRVSVSIGLHRGL